MTIEATQKKILLVGAGAVGSIYGWRLQQAGCSVSVVCRSNYKVVKESGFQIDSTFYGKDSFKPNAVFSSCKQAAEELPEGYDFILVCTKILPDILNPAIILKDCAVNEKSTIVLIQNGIGIEKYYAEMFPSNKLITSIAHVFTKQVKTGVISQVDQASLIFNVFKQNPDQIISEEENIILEEFKDFLTRGKVNAKIEENIQRERWVKIVWNISISPVSVLTVGSNTRELLDCPETRNLLLESMHEAIRVGEAVINKPLTDTPSTELPKQILDKVDNLPEPFYPSMMIDMQNKRPMEIQVIVKNVIDYANNLNINVPILQTMYALLALIQKKNLNN
ncbi:putative 2-dehydropantoate 2-reductase [Smittium mucronatum]|uniref:2-dehydropantoate 2-reductase n=1 Tax=Smittium mucronatum TaxID=133383 RepID=A0A1R0GQX4_9FUNG|nr:putative 2-dehydropantoate 2-reductase [Smittium mucronatum]